jgi:putative aldouronate transport system substrate-binding protein
MQASDRIVVDRRSFIRIATAGVVAGAVGLPALGLQACTAPSNRVATAVPPPPGVTPSTSSARGFQYPTYVPFQGVTPDLPGTADGVSPAFFSYPKTLVKTVPIPPGKGGDVTVLGTASRPLPKPVEQNPAWQKINEGLGANFKWLVSGNSAEGAARLGAIIAGGDVPDIMSLGPTTSASIANLRGFLTTSCADLTPYLSGDAVKDFPNLADFPPFAWKGPNIVIDNRIYSLPIKRSIAVSPLFAHQDILDQAGIGPINSADDFKRAMQAVARPSAGVFGIGDYAGFGYSQQLAARVFGAPNNWGGAPTGPLVKDFETEEFKASLGFLRDIWAAQLFHPDSLTFNNNTVGQAFLAAKFVFYCFAGFDWTGSLRINPNRKHSIIPPFSHDGKAKPQHFLGPGTFGTTAIKKGSPERVKELIGIYNYVHAPFGSQELLLTTYGVEGIDFEFDAEGNPVPAANGYVNSPVIFSISSGPLATYAVPKSREYATMYHDFERQAIAAGVQDRTLGLYSATDRTKGNTLRQTMADVITGVIVGRTSLAEWDQAVKDWQTDGGNQIRDEYQAALATAAAG